MSGGGQTIEKQDCVAFKPLTDLSYLCDYFVSGKVGPQIHGTVCHLSPLTRLSSVCVILVSAGVETSDTQDCVAFKPLTDLSSLCDNVLSGCWGPQINETVWHLSPLQS